MGNVPNITTRLFPKQGDWLGRRTKVCFHFDASDIVMGTLVREDMESPWVTLIRLDDGRVVLGTECQHSPLAPAALDAAPREATIDESRSPDGDGHREQSTEAGDSADSVTGGSPRPQGNVHARSAISDAGAAVPALTDERLAGSEPADSRASVQPRRYSTREILQDAGATHTHGGTLGWNPSWIKADDHDRVMAAAALDAAPRVAWLEVRTDQLCVRLGLQQAADFLRDEGLSGWANDIEAAIRNLDAADGGAVSRPPREKNAETK